MSINCCLLGFGRIGKIHFDNIMFESNYNKWNLSYIVEIESQINSIEKHLEKYFKKPVVTHDFSKVLEDPDISCIFICSPTHMHFTNIMESLSKGKHVFCEKPIDENLENIKKCYELAKEKNLHLFCAFNRRFDNDISMLKTNIHSVGKIHQLISITRDYPYPNVDFLKMSSGLFNDCALHDIDFINWIFNDTPISVYVSAISSKPDQISGGQLDDSSITMEYKNSSRAFIYCSRISNTYDQRIEIFGEKGNLTVDNPYGKVETFTKYGRNISFKQRYENSYKNELIHFYNLVKGKETTFITKEDCLNNLYIIKACEESYRTKKKVLIQY